MDDALKFSEISTKHEDDNFFVFWDYIGLRNYEKHHYRLGEIVTRCSTDVMYSLNASETITTPFVDDLTDYVLKHPTVTVRATYGLRKTYIKALTH